MKTKEKKDLFTKSSNELGKLLSEAREDLVNLNLEKVQNKLKNQRSIFMKRKEIALIATALREKKILEASQVKETK